MSRPVEATRHFPNNYPPDDLRAGETLESEFAHRVLAVLEQAACPLPAREITLRLAQTAGQPVREGAALVILMAKVRRTFSQPRGGVIREGLPGAYVWRLA